MYHEHIYENGYFILQCATTRNRVVNVRYLIETYGYHLTQTESWTWSVDGKVALTLAVENGYAEIVEILTNARDAEIKNFV